MEGQKKGEGTSSDAGAWGSTVAGGIAPVQPSPLMGASAMHEEQEPTARLDYMAPTAPHATAPSAPVVPGPSVCAARPHPQSAGPSQQRPQAALMPRNPAAQMFGPTQGRGYPSLLPEGAYCAAHAMLPFAGVDWATPGWGGATDDRMSQQQQQQRYQQQQQQQQQHYQQQQQQQHYEQQHYEQQHYQQQQQQQLQVDQARTQPQATHAGNAGIDTLWNGASGVGTFMRHKQRSQVTPLTNIGQAAQGTAPRVQLAPIAPPMRSPPCSAEALNALLRLPPDQRARVQQAYERGLQWQHPWQTQMQMSLQQQHPGTAPLPGLPQPLQAAQTPQAELEEEEEGDCFEADDEAVYNEYKPSIEGLDQRHPDPVVESATLAAIRPYRPPREYKLALPQSVINEGLLSDLQLEAVVLACNRHETCYSDGTRAGFFIGDGAGIGKGRELAGLIYENWCRGRRKHIWISTSIDLRIDAARDLADIGATHIPVLTLDKDYSKMAREEGVLFMTYASLCSAQLGGQKSRFRQVLGWLGKDSFEGCLLFDESHRAKNLAFNSEGSGGSKTATHVMKLQASLPKARVVYCSATGASEPRSLAYMSRLGLWGKGTMFDDFKSFLTAVSTSGVGAMELVAMSLKEQGAFVCRGLSFKLCTYEVMTAKIEGTQFGKDYDQAAHLWQRFMQELVVHLAESKHVEERLRSIACLHQLPPPAAEVLSADVSIEDNNKRTKKSAGSTRAWATFWLAHQRFFQQLCCAYKVPKVLELTRKALASGKCVVIGLQSTGEATQNAIVQEAEEELEEEDFMVSNPRKSLECTIGRLYPLPPMPLSLRREPQQEEADVEQRDCRREKFNYAVPGEDLWDIASTSESDGGDGDHVVGEEAVVKSEPVELPERAPGKPPRRAAAVKAHERIMAPIEAQLDDSGIKRKSTSGHPSQQIASQKRARQNEEADGDGTTGGEAPTASMSAPASSGCRATESDLSSNRNKLCEEEKSGKAKKKKRKRRRKEKVLAASPPPAQHEGRAKLEEQVKEEVRMVDCPLDHGQPSAKCSGEEVATQKVDQGHGAHEHGTVHEQALSTPSEAGSNTDVRSFTSASTSAVTDSAPPLAPGGGRATTADLPRDEENRIKEEQDSNGANLERQKETREEQQLRVQPPPSQSRDKDQESRMREEPHMDEAQMSESPSRHGQPGSGMADRDLALPEVDNGCGEDERGLDDPAISPPSRTGPSIATQGSTSAMTHVVPAADGGNGLCCVCRDEGEEDMLLRCTGPCGAVVHGFCLNPPLIDRPDDPETWVCATCKPKVWSSSKIKTRSDEKHHAGDDETGGKGENGDVLRLKGGAPSEDGDDNGAQEDLHQDDVGEICYRCNSADFSEDNQMLCCDGDCGRGLHLKCHDPPLGSVPEADWFCPYCLRSGLQRRKAQKRSRRDAADSGTASSDEEYSEDDDAESPVVSNEERAKLKEVRREGRRQIEALREQWYKEVEERRDRLKQEVDRLRLPGNPLDLIIQEMGGPPFVAEMTGRKARYVANKGGRRWKYQRRNEDLDATLLDVNLKEKELFMNGEKLVAIISDAASSGISLQADKRVPNQRRRVHITLELARSAERAVQQLGRSHRSNQVVGPEYYLVMSSVGGELRFASGIAKKLEALGALTQGDRRARTGQLGLGLSRVNVETKYGEEALREMMQDIRQGGGVERPPPLPPGWNASKSFFQLAAEALKSVGLPAATEAGKKSAGVKIFLNRVLGLELAWQDALLSYFTSILKRLVREAKQNGTYDEGVGEVKGFSITFEGDSRVLDLDYPSDEVPKAREQVIIVDRGVSYERAQAMMQEALKIVQEEAEWDVCQACGQEDGEDQGDGWIICDTCNLSYHMGCLDPPLKEAPPGDWVCPQCDVTQTAKAKQTKTDSKGRAQTRDEKRTGIYKMRYQPHGYALLLPRPKATKAATRAWLVVRPSTGQRDVQLDWIDERYFKVGKAALAHVKAWWQDKHSVSGCQHGPRCRIGPECQAGARLQRYSLMHGNVLLVWAVMQRSGKVIDGHLTRVHEKKQGEVVEGGKELIGLLVRRTTIERIDATVRRQREDRRSAATAAAAAAAAAACALTLEGPKERDAVQKSVT